ncbi:hypothetical protein WJX73_005007 [Symbiochloris irregularis]|uniref:Uncharacterized protein n=1 Tax=Symbiochloris irregularis TaxID=706552 RepID=A0AAW1NQQ0_9CHLO
MSALLQRSSRCLHLPRQPRGLVPAPSARRRPTVSCYFKAKVVERNGRQVEVVDTVSWAEEYRGPFRRQWVAFAAERPGRFRLLKALWAILEILAVILVLKLLSAVRPACRLANVLRSKSQALTKGIYDLGSPAGSAASAAGRAHVGLCEHSPSSM